MHTLDSVVIEGLWGLTTPAIRFQLDPQFNFLIGQNGTGKTTVINLIAAALVADFERLDKIQFTRIVIFLKEKHNRKKPSIEIVKKAKKDVPYYDIEYRIKASAKEDAKTFDLDALAEEQFYRGVAPRSLRERFYRERFLDIQHQLRSMINLCWLSVHRYNEDQRPNDDRKYVPAVDQKLATLKTAFLKYFSQLSRNYSEQTKDFQKKSFLSLLTAEGETSVIDFSKKLDIESEKNSLEKVFEVLGVASSEYNNRLETHFKRFSTSLNKYLDTTELNTVQFAAFYSAWKAHSLVQHYEKLEKNRLEIFRPQNNFLEVINELFDGRKTASISERNEIIVQSRDGRQIPLEDLSSGEKQLLIILGEALLQEGETIVYIADEPELSLHVKWQERLTNSIAKLNPNAQIIFATHSPDIVSDKGDKIINMELLVG